MSQVESAIRELDRSNIRTVHFDGLIVELYRGVALRQNLGPLTTIETDLYNTVFRRGEEESGRVITRNMAHDNVTSMLARRGDEYVGFATGNRFVVSIGEGESEAKVSTGYLSDRIVLPDYREQGLGTLFYELFALVYGFDSEKDPVDMFFHRSQSAAAIRSAIKSGVFRYGYYPFGDGEHMNLYSSNPLARDAAYALWPIIRRHSTAYYPDTGLSKGEYKQPGREFQVIYTPGKRPESTRKISAMMKTLGAKLQDGDAFIAGGLARPLQDILREKPQILRSNPDYAILREAA